MNKESYEDLIDWALNHSEYESVRWIYNAFINTMLCESAYYYSYLC